MKSSAKTGVVTTKKAESPQKAGRITRSKYVSAIYSYLELEDKEMKLMKITSGSIASSKK